MGGHTMTATLTTLLCLGLTRPAGAQTMKGASMWVGGTSPSQVHPGQRDHVQAGILPKPSLWADPGSVIPLGSPVTLWCQGSPQADLYHLSKERVSKPWDTQTPLASRDKVGFSIESMSTHTAGRFQCEYNSSEGWSEPSEPLYLVVKGAYSKPSLSAHPSPVVASGGNVSLLCGHQNLTGTFHLMEEGGAAPPCAVNPQISDQGHHAVFPVGPMTTPHGGSYSCYGSSSSYPESWSLPSDPVVIEVTGLYRAPLLSGQPGAPVLSGDTLTLQCRSEAGFKRFALTKDEELTLPQHLDRQLSPEFPLGRVNSTLGGQYRCYGGHSLSSGWSAPSEPLDVLVAGLYEKPSLLAQPGPSVSTGHNMTLQCRSETPFDTFHLAKEGSVAPSLLLPALNMSGTFQADFTVSSAISAPGDTYRCYGSRSSNPYLLSQPSAPLGLLVSGLKQHLNVLIGASVAFVLLFSLLLFLLIRHQCQGKTRKPGAAESTPKDRGLQKSSSRTADLQEETLYAAMINTRPEEDRHLDSQQSPEDAEPEGVTYSRVNHARHQRGVTTTPPHPPGDALTMRKRQAEEHRQTDGQMGPHPPFPQVEPSEELQDVTYAQLNHLALGRQTTAPPPTQAGVPLAEPSVYASLTIR